MNEMEKLAAAWDEGHRATVEASPGDVYFDAWTDLANPYRFWENQS